MFLGEMMCMVAYAISNCYKRQKSHAADRIEDATGHEVDKSVKWRNTPFRFNPFIFLPPALCDMCATSLMYIGLIMTYPSSYQMLRGSLIIFTGLLSVAFLGRTLRAYQWTGMFIVLVGLIITGVADFLSDDGSMDLSSVITGDLLIIVAQVIAATQMVVEEKFVKNVNPLAAVGSEGMFGFTIMTILLVPMYYIYVPGGFSTSPKNRLDDALDAFVQMGNNWQVCFAMVGSVISIAFFNFAGISVTKEISATTRTVIDSVRTLVVWIVSLGVKWQKFHYLQVVGYVVLVVGMFIYNDIIILPFLRKHNLITCSVCYPPQSVQHTRNSIEHSEDDLARLEEKKDNDSVKGLENVAVDKFDD
ncbi:Chromosome 2 18 [Chamberlinius hualienensis]